MNFRVDVPLKQKNMSLRFEDSKTEGFYIITLIQKSKESSVLIGEIKKSILRRLARASQKVKNNEAN